MRTRRAALTEFLRAEHAGGVVLLVATAAALAWANSPWQDSYEDLWSTTLDLGLELDLRHWVGDGLMTLFFFVVGLEIKRELVSGELRDRRRAALPAIAALGGMAVPALVYLAVAGGDASEGWGIPMATDIALAVGVLRLLGTRVPPGLVVFLLALAIVDDIGAIVAIAAFYTDSLDATAFVGAIAIVAAAVTVRAVGVQWVPIYVALGIGVWLALHESGVHATIAGVIMGLLAPARPDREGSMPAGERIERALHPWVSLAVVPLFALSHAGVSLGADALADAVDSRIAWGVAAGLVLGKLVGISLASWIALRTGVGARPDGVTARDLVGAAALAGIGFTVSIFVAGLAFDDAGRSQRATVGILAGSLAAGVSGVVLLARRRASPAL
ncbi:MAG: Na+/H+ antiporter NhaA [Actinomycetota bacterium]